MFVAACELGCIQKFKLSGEFIARFGSKGTADGQLKWPCGLVVSLSQSEMLFVCDNGNHRIQVNDSLTALDSVAQNVVPSMNLKI